MIEGERWARLLAEAAPERAAQPRRICQMCVATLAVTGAGISLVTAAGDRDFIYATDEVSARIEDLQDTLGEGPCVDAVQTFRPVLLPDLTTSDAQLVERWPAFAQGASEAGAQALFAFPLRLGAIALGALDLYRDEPGDLTPSQMAAALMAADVAAVALLFLGDAHQPDFAYGLDAGQRHEFQVHQAAGMVQVQAEVTTRNAYLLLRARAFATGRSLAEIAGDVVARRLRFTPEEQ